MQPIKVAVIGYGMSAKVFHLPFVNTMPEFQLCAISTSQQQELQQHYPNIEHYADADSLLAESDAELVIITAPNRVHYELASKAIAQGKHVLVEKPFVVNSEQGHQLISEAEAANVKLAVFHNRRWDDDFLTVKTLIEKGELGDVHFIESHFDRFRPTVRQRWRETDEPGNGILFDLGPHLLDQMVALFGMPERLTAQCLPLRPGSPSVDYFHIVLHYPTMQAIVQSSPFSAAPNFRFEVQGDSGSFIAYGVDPQEDNMKAELPLDVTTSLEAMSQERKGTLYDGSSERSVPMFQGGYHHYFRQLATAIRQDQPVPIDARQALLSLQLIELALLSSEQGRTVEVSYE